MSCRWDNGNPIRNILLRNDQNGTIIYRRVPGENNASFRKSINNTSCADSGRYSCIAEGTNEQKTISVWIKCPPQFLHSDVEQGTYQRSQGSDAEFQFSILSYKDITRCMLKGPQDEQPNDCTRNRIDITVSGALPRLNLTVVISNVSEQDSGTWQLSVENGFKGKASIPNTATVKFTLNVTSPLEKEEDDDMWWKPLMIISCVVAVAALGLCVIITVCYRTRKKSKGKEVR
ncbi:uncharacterized protein [Littorina saxatilis]|uniref:uncharacterized protein n=1 Tax=Littorina saxatilis TaxID=31220 RepID=UPI0038B42819